jgi:phosphoglycolate phosphatase-like HAD superfamily hydrolase
VVAEALLASWRDTATRRAIVSFVERVTAEGDPGFVVPAERVAVFDNDGTLWSEKPIPIQLDFTLFRLAELAETDSSLARRQPYQAAVERDYRWLGQAMVKHYHGDDADLGLLMAAMQTAFGGMAVEDFSQEVSTWLQAASHPVLRRPYLACAYVPMIELLRYLEANGFATYIASGGDRDFMRPFAGQLYGIPPERVIGSAFGLDFRSGDQDTDLLYKSKIDFLDDGPEKPVRIWSRTGRDALRLLVLHDDPDREFEYVAGAEDALDRARERSWTVVSIKADWATVSLRRDLNRSRDNRVAVDVSGEPYMDLEREAALMIMRE